MAVFNEPNQWAHPLGNNADASTLPDNAAATAGIASLQKLFQIINATPLEAGGIAPDREDVNALFKLLGDPIFYAMTGGVPSYNAGYDYIAGRVVSYNYNIYKCIRANGVSSTVVAPDSNTAYWQRLDNFVRSVNGVNADASGNVTLVIPSSVTIVETYMNGSAWYRIWSDGWLEQGGTGGDATIIVASPYGTDSTLSFLKPFKTTGYSLVAVNGGTNADNLVITADTIGIREKSTTTSIINLNGPGGSFVNQFTWYACGQGA